MNNWFLLIVILFSISLNSNSQTFRIKYLFNNTLNAEIMEGKGTVFGGDAVSGGAYLFNPGFTSEGNDVSWKADVVNNNATNYKNTYLRFDLSPKPGYKIIVTNISVRQKCNQVSPNNLFRIGCQINGKPLNNANPLQSTSNIAFTSSFSTTSFMPGAEFAVADGYSKVTVWLTAREIGNTTINWNVDEVEISGTLEQSDINKTITINDGVKQRLRFGIDAERLWYWQSSLKAELADLAVGELKSDFVRVAINCAYEREQGVKRPETYAQIIEMMNAMKSVNPEIKFFASPRPLDEAYTPAEETAIFGSSDGCPWAPYPGWIMGFSGYGGVFGGAGFNQTKALQYLADYLNLMNSNGLTISYLDLTNEKEIISPAICKYIYDNLPALLQAGVKVPGFVVPSSWSREQGTSWLNSVNKSNHEDQSFLIAATHNTDLAGSPEAFASAATALGKEAWNSELHGWTGIELRDEILNSTTLWEHLRAGFSGIDSWLFFGPYGGKDHTMIWSKNGATPIRSGKYEIYKKVVNTCNGGNYIMTSQLSDQLPTAAFIKNGIMQVWILNQTKFDFSEMNFQFANQKISGNQIEVTCFNASGQRSGQVSYLQNSSSGAFSYDINSESLYCFQISLITAEQHEKNVEINIFPNPSNNGIFNLVYPGNDFVRYEIFNSAGKHITSGMVDQNQQINLMKQPKGLYLILIDQGKRKYTKKLIIN